MIIKYSPTEKPEIKTDMTNSEKKGKLFVITAPSGAGKTTIRNYLLVNHPELYFSVSATTRQPRIGEIIHKDYHFMTQEEYNEHLRNNNFLEHAEVFGNYYGTLKNPIIERLENGIDVLLDVDTKGAKQVKQKLPEAVLIFIEPPSMQELERRLRSRGTESEEVVCKRLREAEFEMDKREFFDYRVVNDVLEIAEKEIGKILFP